MWLRCVPAINVRRKEADVRSLPLPHISVQSVACAIPIIKAGVEVPYKLIHRVGEEILSLQQTFDL